MTPHGCRCSRCRPDWLAEALAALLGVAGFLGFVGVSAWLVVVGNEAAGWWLR